MDFISFSAEEFQDQFLVFILNSYKYSSEKIKRDMNQLIFQNKRISVNLGYLINYSTANKCNIINL